MSEPRMEPIGQVVAFFAHPSAAAIVLTAPLRVGDTIYLKGHTTDVQQLVESLQVNHQTVEVAQAGQTVGLKTAQRCRKHDLVYKLVGV